MIPLFSDYVTGNLQWENYTTLVLQKVHYITPAASSYTYHKCHHNIALATPSSLCGLNSQLNPISSLLTTAC